MGLGCVAGEPSRRPGTLLHSPAPHPRAPRAVSAHTQPEHAFRSFHPPAAAHRSRPQDSLPTALGESPEGRPAPPNIAGRWGCAPRGRGRRGSLRALRLAPAPPVTRSRPHAPPPPPRGRAVGPGLNGRERGAGGGRAGARGRGLAAGRRPPPSMRTEEARGVKRRPLRARTEAAAEAAAAPAGRGTWRSPLRGAAGPTGWGRRRRCVWAPVWPCLAAPPPPPRTAPRARLPQTRFPDTGARAARTDAGRCGGGAGVRCAGVGSAAWGPLPQLAAAARRLIHCWKLPGQRSRVNSLPGSAIDRGPLFTR